MADFDFTGLTEAHRRLLDRGGWTVAEASADNVPPITGAALAAGSESIRGPPARSSTSCAPPKLAPPAVVADASGPADGSSARAGKGRARAPGRARAAGGDRTAGGRGWGGGGQIVAVLDGVKSLLQS